jgi:hypothetical protein
LDWKIAYLVSSLLLYLYKITPKVETIIVEELNSWLIGINKRTRGQNSIKNSSSRNKYTIMMVVLRPALIPSLL